jgi:glutaminyl-tRNA synthetase
VSEAVPAQIRLYEHLFTDPQPDSGEKNYLDFINPTSKQVIEAFVEPSISSTQAEDRFQFERHGYFVADRYDCKPGRLVFNRSVGLKDSWK